MTDNTEVKSMCIICTEKYTSRLRVPITCPFCVKTACHTCVTTYLLSSPNINPQCMFTECKKEWSFEFVASSTQSSFHNNKYRDYRASLLIERERSLLPQTQHLVVIKKKEIEMRRQIRELEKQNRLLKIQIEENKNTMHNINQQYTYTNTETLAPETLTPESLTPETLTPESITPETLTLESLTLESPKNKRKSRWDVKDTEKPIEVNNSSNKITLRVTKEFAFAELNKAFLKGITDVKLIITD